MFPSTLAPETNACRSCGAEHAGPFCNRCGQRVHAGRFRLRPLVGEFFSNLLELNRGWLFTVRSLLVRPGETIRAYLGGSTVRYTHPAKFYLVGLAVLQLVALRVGMLDSFAAGFLHDRQSVGAAGGAEAERLIGLLQRYFVALSVLGLPAQVLSTKLFFRRARLSVAEHTIVHLYLTGVTYLVVAPFLLFAGSAHDLLGGWSGHRALTQVAEYIGVALAAGLYGRALAGVLDEPLLRAALRTFAALALSFVGFMFALAAVQAILLR